jgi:hypothetical protein
MEQAIFWNNLIFGFFFVLGEQYLFALLGVLIVVLLVGAFITKHLTA